MNVWMKRGLQTALVTGGLLTAGTGLAAADDSATVTVPVTVTDNALAVLGAAPGTTPAEIDLPALEGTVGADLGGLVVAVPIHIGGNAADVAGIDVAQPASAPASGGSSGGSGSSGSVVDVDVPVIVTGNAIGALGDATAASSSGEAPAAQPEAEASLLDVDVPVLVCGNGVGVLGDAAATCTAPAPAAGGATDGGLVGVDAPVTVCGVAAGVLGDAAAGCTAPTGGSGGSTDGTEPVVDVDAPISVCGIGIGVLGGASTTCSAPVTPVVPVTPVGTGTPVQPVSGPVGGRFTVGGSAGMPAAEGAADRTVTGDGASALAYTGSPLLWKLLGGLLAMAMGLGLTVLGRRRAGVLS